MTRAELLDLRQRVVAKGQFPKLLAAIDLMILHHESFYEHERHPAVRSYRVACHASAVMRQAVGAVSADQVGEAEKLYKLAVSNAYENWHYLESNHPDLAAKVLAGPNSYKLMGITPVT